MYRLQAAEEMIDLCSYRSCIQDGRTPLHWAASTSNLAMNQLLLSYRPNVDERDLMGWTPLMIAGA